MYACNTYIYIYALYIFLDGTYLLQYRPEYHDNNHILCRVVVHVNVMKATDTANLSESPKVCSFTLPLSGNGGSCQWSYGCIQIGLLAMA